MKTLRFFRLEVRRLLQSRFTWLIVGLTVFSPMLGLVFYQPADASTMQSLYLADPAICGGIAGAFLFGGLAVYEADRGCRHRMEVLVDAVTAPRTMALVRLLALMVIALLTLGLTMLVWLPFSKWLIGAVFSGGDYVLAYLLLMGLALPLGILAVSALYQFTGRADLAMVIFVTFAALSLTVWADDWRLCWLNPCVWALSDDFSNFRIFRAVAYMRLTWLAGLSGVWVLSWLCVRQYGKGFLGSFRRSLRRVYRPMVALILLASAGTAYAAQPFVDHSNLDESAMTFYELPYCEDVVCTGRSAQVFPDVAAGTLSGSASFAFQNTSGEEQVVAFGVNPGYDISKVQANGEDVPFSVSDYQEYNEAMLEVTIPGEEAVTLTMDYAGFPEENRMMATMQGGTEISARYLCLENATLSPRLMNVLPDGAMYPATIEITLPASMMVVPFDSSEAQVVAEHEDGSKTWRYESAGTGGILYAGDYVCEDIAAGGIDIEFYYGRKHQTVMEEAEAVDAVKAVVDYCTEHYGPLSFGAGDSLKLIQSRVAGGGYATDGASLLDEADFTADNLANAEKGAGAGEVMIHELVHQWWGLGAMFDTADPASAWSAEGLTVYTTYRIAKMLYGKDYATAHYIDQWQQAVDDYYLDYYVRHPDVLATLPEDKQMAITDNLTYVRQYCEMPLAILKAETLVGGEEAMDEILGGLFGRELDPASPYLTYEDFLDACGLTEEDLNLG